jgi:hypothetical protein
MSTLISVEQLASMLKDDNLLIVDTRFKLEDTGYGRAAYDGNHIPGALYMDLDKDLSAPVVPGKTGRHPLPDVGEFEATPWPCARARSPTRSTESVRSRVWQNERPSLAGTRYNAPKRPKTWPNAHRGTPSGGWDALEPALEFF